MRRLYLILTLLLVTLGIQAQEYIKDSRHYLNLSFGGGINDLSYSVENGKATGETGYLFHAGYLFLFDQHWGVMAALGFQTCSSKATLDYMYGISSVDTDGDTYELRTYYNDWNETQQAFFIDIPLALQFRQNVSRHLTLSLSTGAGISIPVNSTYEVNSGTIETRGYYSQWDVELADMPQHGFTTIATRYNGDISLKPSYSVFVDAGGLIGITRKMDLFIGAYVACGLNNMITPGSKDVYQNNTYNGVLASTQISNVSLLNIGLKIGGCWSFGD